MTTINPSQSTASYDSIKLGIDAHAQYYWVSRQVDGATPQPVQKMTYDELLLFVVKQQKLTGNPAADSERSFAPTIFVRMQKGTNARASGRSSNPCRCHTACPGQAAARVLHWLL